MITIFFTNSKKMKKKIKIAYHPWVYLKEKLEVRNWSQKQFAEIIWLSTPEVNLIIKWKRNLTPNLAFLIANTLGEDTYVRLWLQAKRDTYQMEINTENQKIWFEIYQKALQFA